MERHLMEQENVLYFNGNSARPLQVRVLLFNDCIDVHNGADDQFINSFSLKGATHNQVGYTHYLYLDSKGLQYLQFSEGHQLATIISKQVSDANPHLWQKLMSQKLVLLVPFMLLLGAGLYFLMVTLVPFLGTRIISVDHEIIMGEKLRQIMIQEELALGARMDTAGTLQLQ